ncbi:hypothetical protein N7456_012034 [Penicillium angulare]|uniref:AB hydrolase-1 domain-containing protein n=1 Tax=Penicillium angulare TaxID=116970 RepID=A0A9W9EUX1_9EURO|nr:hypothetical protein N7456_012034 [Penicillium angulare]
MSLLAASLQGQRTSFHVTINSRQTFIEVDGNGPYMIMTHGLGTSSNVFQPLVDIHSARFTIIRFDWPGHGQSDKLTKNQQPLSVPEFLADLEGVMDYFSIDSAVLLGHSLGGIISMHFAAQYPERVKGLVVIGAGRAKVPGSSAHSNTLAQGDMARKMGMLEVATQRIPVNFTKESSLLARAFLRQVLSTTDPEGYAQVCEALCDKSHIDPDYSRICCPTSLIWGAYDEISPMGIGMEIKSLIAESGNLPELCVLGTGHMPIIDDVFGVTEAVDRLLSRVGAKSHL